MKHSVAGVVNTFSAGASNGHLRYVIAFYMLGAQDATLQSCIDRELHQHMLLDVCHQYMAQGQH